MRLLRARNADPISNRSRVLSAEIAALEVQIRELNSQLEQDAGRPRLRSATRPSSANAETGPAARAEPVFEPVDQRRLAAEPETENASTHYNELGVRKYDLAAAWRRFQQHFRGPAASNPRLINYLAAGSIQGLRPLRYEKRVARNRVLALTSLFIIVLYGIIAVFWRH